jgi:4-diphosphocytidyl-2-C-methyl-D-erythritol kinase
MLRFSPCKINIGLNIINKREDGFHNLQSIFYPVPLHDVLEIVKNNDAAALPVVFNCSGLKISGTPADNIVLKAIELLKADYPISPIKVHLHKVIPMGAGLGGGSANGAITLLLINELFELNIPSNTLLDYAAKLGSDCTFFIYNSPCFVEGRGEIITPVELDLKGKYLTLIYPQIHINTGVAFSKIIPKNRNIDFKNIRAMEISEWQHIFINDFEKPMCNLFPDLNELITTIKNTGAEFVSMTGSGSTIYAISSNELDISHFNKSDNFIFQTQL